jgi:hypothetical protein
MGKKKSSAEELLARAEARGYRPAAHREVDRTRTRKTYTPDVIKAQNRNLKRYEE